MAVNEIQNKLIKDERDNIMINQSLKTMKVNTHATKPVINSDNFIVNTKEINSYNLDLFLKTLFHRKFGLEKGLGRIFVSTKNNTR